MAEIAVAACYAKALFDLADEVDKQDRIYNEIKELRGILEANDELNGWLKNPEISREDKKSVLDRIFSEEMSEEALNFVKLTLDKGRFGQLERIVKEYGKLYDAQRGVSYGSVTSAFPLDRDQLERLNEKVSKLLGKRVELSNDIDKALIGGVVICADGKLIDCSVRSELEKMLKKLR